MPHNPQELLEFLYRSPIALVTAKFNGDIESMTPLACQWLMPLAPQGELENLFDVLRDITPELPSLVKDRTSEVICNAKVLHLDADTVRERYLSLTVHLFSDSSIAAIFTDVSSEHRQIDYAQQGLRTLRNTLHTSPIAVGITRIEDEEVVFFNKAYADLAKGKSPHETTPDVRNIHKDLDWFETIKQRLAKEDFILNHLVELEPTASMPQRRVWALASYMSIDYEGEKSILAWLYDVTDIQQAKQAADEASHAKGQFLATMSHEIRTPMNAILGMLQLFERTALTQQQSDYIEKASAAAQSLLRLLDDVLDFSKVEAGKLELESQPFRLETLFRDLSVLLMPNPKQHIEVLFDIDSRLPDVLVGDRHRLRQILINLGGNAIKFTERGQVVIAAKLAALAGRTARVTFSVEDSGIGITPAQQQRIFAEFTQAESSTTRRYGGTGLGLAISKSLVELMGGTLQLVSLEEQGSTFSFDMDFPLDHTAANTLPMAEIPQVKPQRVLIVEDNPVAARLLSRMVQDLGWACSCVSNGTQAIETLSRALAVHPTEPPFTLFLVNWQMPQMDGWDVSRHIKALSLQDAFNQPHIILLSDNGRQNLSQRTEDEQALVRGLLVKPFTQEMLLETVADAHSDRLNVRQASGNRAGKHQLRGMRILVVEDNQINQQIAEELLSAEGAIVSLAANGALGVEAVEHAAPQFDVVLMDLQMPVMDGYSATAAIRNQLGLTRLPIVAMTANAMAGDRDACIAAGMNDHVGKPFDLAKLISLLIRITGITPRPASEPEETSSLAQPSYDIEGVDLNVAMARMASSKSLYLRTAKDFLKILASVHSELQTLLLAEDWPKLKMRLHTLKGNAGTLGLKVLAQKAAQLEQLCLTSKDAGRLSWQLQSLAIYIQHALMLLQQVIATLQTEPRHHATTPTSAIDNGKAAQALAELESLLAVEDLSALYKFAEMRDCLMLLPNGLSDQLESAMQELDLQSALKVCVSARAAL